jgi:hypothetical protein
LWLLTLIYICGGNYILLTLTEVSGQNVTTNGNDNNENNGTTSGVNDVSSATGTTTFGKGE